MGLATQIKQLFTYTIGGTNPTGTASATGDMSQILKFLAGASTGLRAGIALPQNNVNLPGLLAPGVVWSAGVSGGTYPAAYGSGGTWATVGSPTLTFDGTAKLITLGNTTGSVSGAALQLSMNNYWHPYTPAPFKSGSANLAAIVIPTQYTQLHMEFYGKWASASAHSNDRGIGLQTGGVAASQYGTARHVGFYRKSGGSGWTVDTADGTTQSDTSEASDTSDGSYHWFRICWDGTVPNVKLYVDEVLKVTKTTNIPAFDTNNNMGYLGFQGAAADATKLFEMACGLVYWS